MSSGRSNARHFLSQLMAALECSPRCLDSSQADRITYRTDAALAGYGSLAAKCTSLGLGYFPIRPKCHAPFPIEDYLVKYRINPKP